MNRSKQRRYSIMASARKSNASGIASPSGLGIPHFDKGYRLC